jgi:dipeptidyl-peptidase-4
MFPRLHHRSVRVLTTAALNAVLVAALLAATPAAAQERRPPETWPHAPNAADYARAERLLPANVRPLVVGGVVRANWLPDERFWYQNHINGGYEFVLVTPATRSRKPLFDHATLATALSAATKGTYTAWRLPFQTVDVSADGKSVSFNLNDRRWTCDVLGARCADAGAAVTPREPEPPWASIATGPRPPAGNAVPSPDGTREVFIRDWNLWVRDIATKQERQLTTDGVKYFGYATDNAGWSSSDRAIVLWSPDSKKVATYQQDEREVGEMYLVNTPVNPVGHPTLRVSKFPLPGDKVVAMLHRVVIDIDSGRTVRFEMPPDYHRATLDDDVSVNDWQWSPDGSQLAFISTARDHKQAVLRVAETATGTVRTVMDEKVATQYESRVGCQILWGTKEVIWYSERDNYGHLYLYDLSTGTLKNSITSGPGPVMEMIRLDEKTRTVWFQAQGREAGEDPYFRHYYRVGLDGKRYTSLTPITSDHSIQLSPSGRLLVDTYSQPDQEPAVALRDGDGRFLMMLEKANISKLRATGWQPPMRVTMKARDGKTDIYGLLFRPTDFNPTRTYPIVNYVYPGPQTGSVGSRAFSAVHRDNEALAELGFIVVAIDGMGTPGRSKSFQDAYYGAMGRDNTIPDQIAGMKELAAKYPWIDLSRAGIWGHSGGGFATTTAMFRFPDFFKAGIAESGNHDQRVNEDDWGERYQGLLTRNADGTDNYQAEANQEFAKNLKGHLLLAHGTMDTNVPPYQTLLVADALIKANKDFDLLMLPNQNHGFGDASAYMMRRRWDYFVKWLQSFDPPKEYLAGKPLPPEPVREATRAEVLRGAYGPYRANNDLLFYHLDIRIDPEKKWIGGKTTVRFRMLKDDTRIQLDLTEALGIDKILLGTTPLKYQREFGAVFVDFPETLKKGRVYDIDFYYSGQPKSFGRFGGITFQKDPAGRPWVNTACQGIGASIWWPNKDQQEDEVESMKISVAIPNGLTDVSNGKFVGKTDLGDGYTRWDWLVQYPINNYDVSVNIGTYEHFTDTASAMTLDFYTLPENVEKGKVQFAQAKGMIEAFEHYFGRYPFEKDGYKLVEAPYSGMEHQTAVTYGNHFANGYLEADWTGVGISTRFDFIIIHESAHEWFGNAVTSKDVADMWIHEAWGTYMEALYVEHRWGYQDALTYLNGYQSKVRNREPIITPTGLNRTPPQDQYFKGALFINSLRHVVDNDRLWWAILKEFFQTFKYRTITTEDVVAFFNRKTKMNLTPLFDQYLRHPGIPTLDLQFQDGGQVAYRWNADEKALAMPIRVGQKGHWQIVRPTTEWQVMTTTLAKDDFNVATDLYYVNVSKQ